MAKYNACVIGRPDWIDLPIGDWYKPRFTHLMAYMAWIIQSIVDYAKGKMDVVVDLYKDDINRDTLKSTLDSTDAIFYCHGSHGACNAVAGSPYTKDSQGLEHPSTVICSPRRGFCGSDNPIVGDTSVDCVPSPNQDWFVNRVVYLNTCSAGRWLAEDMVNAGAKAAIGYSDLLYFAIGRNPDEYWVEEVFKNCYVSGAFRLIDGGTVGEAVEVLKDTYNYYITKWLPENHPDMANTLNGVLAFNRDHIVLYGDPTARIRSEVVIPPPITKPVRRVPWEILIPSSLIIGLGMGFILGGR
jgi:hypothetical protein